MSDTIRDPDPSRPSVRPPQGTVQPPTSWVEPRKEPLPPEDVQQATIIAPASLEEYPEEVRPFVQDPNRQINQYILAKVLGKGGMGEVWKAWDRKLSRWAAIKFLLGQSQEGVLRFKREAKMAARLTHPNIAPVHEVGEAPSRQPGQPACHFLAMEYIDGATLGSAKLSMRDRVDVFVKVAQGLEAAHKGGIVHRDIKPANIMLTKENWPYVMDFGLAKSLDGDNNLSATGAVMGTPAFMPPEQVEGLADQIGPWSDVYSLGATMYAVFCGVHPFTAQTTLQLLQKVVNEAPPSPRSKNAEISADLEAIILKAMAKKKEDRYQSAAAVADALKRVLLKMDSAAAGVAEPPAPAPTPLSRPVPPVSQAPKVWPIVAMLLVMFAGVGAGCIWLYKSWKGAAADIVAKIELPKPEVKPEVKTDPKPEIKPEVKPDLKPEPKPVVGTDVKPDAKPEVKPPVTPDVKPEMKPDVKPPVTPEVKPEVKPVLKPEAKVEPIQDVKPVVVPDVRPPASPTADQLTQRGFDYLAARYRASEFATDSDLWAACALLRSAIPGIPRPRILEFLRGTAWEQSTHATSAASMRVLGLAFSGDAESRARTADGANYLVQTQGRNGLWADGPKVAVPPIPPAAPESALLVSGDPAPRRVALPKAAGEGPDGDLPATSLAVMALFAAEACGHQVPKDTWKRALLGIEGKGGKDAASLYLCRAALGSPDAAQAPAIQAALRELGATPDRSLWTLAAMERAGGVTASPRLGDLEWYGAGVQALAAAQQPDGSWVDANDPVRGTAMGLLFLTKSTAALKAAARKGGIGRLELKSLGGVTNLMFVLDASGRMRQELGDRERFDVARDMIAKIVEQLPEGAMVGIRIFGSRLKATEPGCETDSILLVPPVAANKRQVLTHLSAQRVQGLAPLTFSIIETIKDLLPVRQDVEMAVVLLVDGKDSDRRSNPVPAVGDLAGSHPNMKVHVVGFETEDEDILERLKKMATAGGGVYIPATDAKAALARLKAATIGEQEYQVLDDKGEVVVKGHLGDAKPLPDGHYTLVCGKARQEFWVTPELTTRIIVDQAKLAEIK
jgi:predicted Ser/Thr protein kinase